MQTLPLTLNIQSIGEFTLITHNGFYMADIPYKYQGNTLLKVSMNADDNIDNSIKNLELIFENIESFIEEARKIIAHDCDISYNEAMQNIPLHTLYVSYKGDYHIEFINTNQSTNDCIVVAAISGNIEGGHFSRPSYYA